MDRKTAVTTGWVLVGGTLLLGGCMTPGFQNQEPPGFSATFQEYDRQFQTVGGLNLHRQVNPARFDLEMPDASEMSAKKDVPHEELALPTP